jgi:hypothetical protein
LFADREVFYFSIVTSNLLYLLTNREVFISASWWRLYGTETPALHKMTTKILSLTASSSGCERNWSGFDGVSTYLLSKLQQHYNKIAELKGLLFLIYRCTLRREIGLLQTASTSWSTFNSTTG